MTLIPTEFTFETIEFYRDIEGESGLKRKKGEIKPSFGAQWPAIALAWKFYIQIFDLGGIPRFELHSQSAVPIR